MKKLKEIQQKIEEINNDFLEILNEPIVDCLVDCEEKILPTHNPCGKTTDKCDCNDNDMGKSLNVILATATSDKKIWKTISGKRIIKLLKDCLVDCEEKPSECKCKNKRQHSFSKAYGWCKPSEQVTDFSHGQTNPCICNKCMPKTAMPSEHNCKAGEYHSLNCPHPEGKMWQAKAEKAQEDRREQERLNDEKYDKALEEKVKRYEGGLREIIGDGSPKDNAHLTAHKALNKDCVCSICKPLCTCKTEAIHEFNCPIHKEFN